jgi:hypothetical protein
MMRPDTCQKRYACGSIVLAVAAREAQNLPIAPEA